MSSHFFWPGVVAIWGALFAGLASVYSYFRVERGDASYLPFARRTYGVFVTAIVAASAVLMTLILQHRFDVAYVREYSSVDLPTHFLVSTFWAGQEGSFLLWLFWGAVIGLFVWRSAKEQEAPVMIVYLATLLGLVAILCRQSPFKLLPDFAADGTGLNPLLQDPWMVIHPPIMFLGFASLGVPFSFSIAALWKKRWDGWIQRCIPWALLTFITLGSAILMGGYWAYKTLGWGGYWGWDPVENTSLVPWLCTTALVHGMFLQRSRNRHRRINLLLAVLAYVCILYGTFLTRSGVLADFSVHSFVDLGITSWLVVFLMTFLLLGVGMLAWRWKQIPREEEETPVLSRTVLFVVGIALFCTLAFVILLGTSAPLLTRLTGNPSQVAQKFYNVTTAPMALLILLLASLVPFVGWKSTGVRQLLRESLRSLGVGLLGVAIALVAGQRSAEVMVFVGLALFTFDMNLRAVLRKIRQSKLQGAGGYLAHAGVGIMFVGIIVSAVSAVSQRVTLPRNVPTQVGRYTMTFTRVVPPTPDSKQGMEIAVRTETGKTFYAYPRMYMNPRTQQLMANPAIRKTPLMDLYISPQEYDPGQPASMGKVLRLTQGQTAVEAGYKFQFEGFDVDTSKMMQGAKTLHIKAHVMVIPPSGKSEQTTLQYVAHLDGSAPNQGRPAAIAGTQATMVVEGVSATDESVQLLVSGLSAEEVTPPTPESLSIDVTRKPLISLVWGGFYVMMTGGILAFLKRSRDAHRFVLDEAGAAASHAPSKAHAGVPRPLAPSPGTARVRR
jgi:cytochrome c-type biogenesis protein CcmF